MDEMLKSITELAFDSGYVLDDKTIALARFAYSMGKVDGMKQALKQTMEVFK